MNNYTVANLNVARVTWASAFCAASERAGWRVVDSPEPGFNIFIGDEIDWSKVREQPGVLAYFLARFDGTDREITNASRCDVCVVPSTQEAVLVNRSLAAHALSATVKVHGFPINLPLLEITRLRPEDRQHKSVAFVGADDPAKGRDLELAIIERLHAKGYECFHLSPYNVASLKQIERLGGKVLEYTTGTHYLNTLASMEYVVCTSERESLFVSGIEAAALEVSTILPDNQESGYNDWCDQERLYTQHDASDAVELVLSTPPANSGNISVAKYNEADFFAGLGASRD